MNSYGKFIWIRNRIFLLFFFSFVISEWASAQTTNPAPYCFPSADSMVNGTCTGLGGNMGYGFGMSKVRLNISSQNVSYSKSSNCYGSNSGDVYRFWQDTFVFRKNERVNLFVSTGVSTAKEPVSVAVWIDTNMNNQFDSTEMFGSILYSHGSGFTFSFTIQLPCQTRFGLTRMRIRTKGFTALTKYESCNNSSGFGETWDFLVHIRQDSLIKDFDMPDSVFVKRPFLVKSKNNGNQTSSSYDIGLNGTYEIIGNNTQYTISQIYTGSPKNLCIRNRISNCDETVDTVKCIRVLAPTAKPEADFYACRRSIEQYDYVQVFSNTGQGAWQWEWDVYDSITYAANNFYPGLSNDDVQDDVYSNGENRYSENPTFAFDYPGTYTVVLKARNDLGLSVVVKKAFIHAILPINYNMYSNSTVQQVNLNAAIIQSYGYGYSNYQDNISSKMLIAPSSKQKFSLAFKDIQLADVYDSIQIYDDNKKNPAKRIGLITSADNGRQPIFKSSGQHMFIHFTTDSAGGDKGFEATYYLDGMEPDTLGFEINHSVLEAGKPAKFYNRFNNQQVHNYYFKWEVDGVEQKAFENLDSLIYTFSDTVNHRVCLTAYNCYNTYQTCKQLRFNEGIYGYVYNDTNNNCSFDSLEAGLSHIPVVLFDSSNVEMATAYTNAQGLYYFTVPQGKYKLALDTGITVYQPFCSSLGTRVLVTLDSSNSLAKDINFELQDLGISGFVFVDRNKNCLSDSGDLGLNEITVKLYDSAMNLLQSTSTNQSGYYRFNPPRGKYYVGVFLTQTKYLFTCQINGLSGLITIDANNKSKANLNFGLGEYGIRGFVYNDFNSNCSRESSDGTYQNIRVRLLDSNKNQVAFTYTGLNGSYVFYTAKGNYFVMADPGALPFKSKCKPKGYAFPVLLDSMSYFKENVNFDLHGIDSGIFGRVFGDLNQNCVLNNTDNFYAGIPLVLYDSASNPIAQTVTDRNGNYFFDLDEGRYKVGINFHNLPYIMQCQQDSLSAWIILDTGQIIVRNINFSIQPIFITGTVYRDLDSNCVFSSGDVGINNIKIKLYDSAMNYKASTFTNSQGVYTFYQIPGTYTLVLDTVNISFRPKCIKPIYDSTVLLLGGNAAAPLVNFELDCGPQFDIGIQSIANRGTVFPGREHQLHVWAGDLRSKYTNKKVGCHYSGSGTLEVKVQGKVTYKGKAPGSRTTNASGNTYTYYINDFSSVNNKYDFGLLFQVDTNAQMGDTIKVWAAVTPKMGDADSSNNSRYYEYYVRNSYDPNIKEVFPNSVYPGFNDWLTYTVHFQNTGNAAAFDILVKDTLDSQLDGETFEVLSSSHEMVASLQGSVLHFDFTDINLPDSFSDPKGSEGFVQFRIKPKQGILLGSQIKNKAHIFFDYNAPIVTNTVGTQYVKDNYVLIPDPNFVQWLHMHHGACMKGNKVDTTCGSVLTAQTLDVQNQAIQTLEGLQYFKRLENLYAQNNLLTDLPPLRVSLKKVYLENNQFTAVSIKTNALTELVSPFNLLTELPDLPVGLQILDVANNQIICFEPFHANLPAIDISNNLNTCLPNYIAAMDAATKAIPLCLKNDSSNNPNACVSTVTSLEHVFKSAIQIYPNPGQGLFQIKLDESLAGAGFVLEVFNSLGQQIAGLPLTHSMTYLDLSGYQNGVYLLRLTYQSQIFITSIIKQE